jgi:ABC-type uncharacterized transport system ATPase subunit
VLVLSEELEELFDISDRLHVMAKGQMSPVGGPRTMPAWSASVNG